MVSVSAVSIGAAGGKFLKFDLFNCILKSIFLCLDLQFTSGSLFYFSLPASGGASVPGAPPCRRAYGEIDLAIVIGCLSICRNFLI